MPVQVICNFHKDLIESKQAKLQGAILETRSNKDFFSTQGLVILPDQAGFQTPPKFYACPGYLQS